MRCSSLFSPFIVLLPSCCVVIGPAMTPSEGGVDRACNYTEKQKMTGAIYYIFLGEIIPTSTTLEIIVWGGGRERREGLGAGGRGEGGGG